MLKMSLVNGFIFFEDAEAANDFEAAQEAAKAAKDTNDSIIELLKTKKSFVYLLKTLNVFEQTDPFKAVSLVSHLFKVNFDVDILSGESLLKLTNEYLCLSLMAFLRADIIGDNSDEYEADKLIKIIEKSETAYFKEDVSYRLKIFETVLDLNDYNKESESTIFVNNIVDTLMERFHVGLESVKK